MTDIMPKFDNTLQMKLEASALYRQKMMIANGTTSITSPDHNNAHEKLTIIRFMM